MGDNDAAMNYQPVNGDEAGGGESPYSDSPEKFSRESDADSGRRQLLENLFERKEADRAAAETFRAGPTKELLAEIGELAEKNPGELVRRVGAGVGVDFEKLPFEWGSGAQLHQNLQRAVQANEAFQREQQAFAASEKFFRDHGIDPRMLHQDVINRFQDQVIKLRSENPRRDDGWILNQALRELPEGKAHLTQRARNRTTVIRGAVEAKARERVGNDAAQESERAVTIFEEETGINLAKLPPAQSDQLAATIRSLRANYPNASHLHILEVAAQSLKLPMRDSRKRTIAKHLM